MFQQESDAIRKIVKRGVTPVDLHGEVSLRVFSRPNLTATLVMKNNNAPKPTLANETNVVYRFECTVGPCRGRNIDYIGLTTTTLQKRMESHRYNGAIHTHYKKAHDRRPKTKELVESSSVLHHVPKYHRLAITEAVSIELRKPILNVQREFDLVLPSCRKRNRQTDKQQEEPAALPPNADTPPETTDGERGGDNGDPAPTDYVRSRLRPRMRPGIIS